MLTLESMIGSESLERGGYFRLKDELTKLLLEEIGYSEERCESCCHYFVDEGTIDRDFVDSCGQFRQLVFRVDKKGICKNHSRK